VTRASAKAEPSAKARPSRNTRSSDAAKVPRSSSDVFRFWMSIGVGLLVGIAFEITVIVLQVTGARPVPTDEQFNLEFGFGARLTIWIGFAITYLALGLRAFSRCDRALCDGCWRNPSRHRVSKGGCWPGEAVLAGRSPSHCWHS
jgi:hypothetical protein